VTPITNWDPLTGKRNINAKKTYQKWPSTSLIFDPRGRGSKRRRSGSSSNQCWVIKPESENPHRDS
jgi:hypothetical protein